MYARVCVYVHVYVCMCVYAALPHALSLAHALFLLHDAKPAVRAGGARCTRAAPCMLLLKCATCNYNKTLFVTFKPIASGSMQGACCRPLTNAARRACKRP